MCFSDSPFAYGPFVPHHIPRQYVESYFSHHGTDSFLSLSTTVEDVSVIKPSNTSRERWRLTLRKYDAARHVDIWWEEEFDAVVIANGHYSVPFVRNLSFLLVILNWFDSSFQKWRVFSDIKCCFPIKFCILKRTERLMYTETRKYSSSATLLRAMMWLPTWSPRPISQCINLAVHHLAGMGINRLPVSHGNQS